MEFPGAGFASAHGGIRSNEVAGIKGKAELVPAPP